MILRGGGQCDDVRLDRVVQFDERSRAFPSRPLTAGKRNRSYTWRCSSFLDQGAEGACHSDETEVLTDKGWKLFADLDARDLLGTVSPATGALEFQSPTARQNFHYEGDMVEVNGRSLKFSVTPNHRMYVRKWDESARRLGDAFEFVEAGELGWYSGLMDAPSGHEGCELDNFNLPVRGGEVTISVCSDAMMRFMGIFLAEGCLYHHADSGSYRVEIAAVKAHCREEVLNIVSALGYNVTSYLDRYTINSKPLFTFLADCYAGGALTKHVPAWVKGASQPQLRLFIDAFALGDGHTTPGGRVFLYTSSPRMADDLQEIYLRIGRRSKVAVREPRDAMIEGRVIKAENCAPSYVVSPWDKRTLSIEHKKQVSLRPYSGRVYCATVPNGILVTRLKGTVLISGNCVGFGVAHELAARPAEVRGLGYDDAIKFYHDAQRIDPWEGGSYPGASPRYEGTSVLAGVKVARAAGWCEEYRWGFGLEDLVSGVGYNGPAILGLRWYEDMFEPGRDGVIRPTGRVMGGHCLLCNGVNVRTGYFHLHNSWGRAWGVNGGALISFFDMDKLLREQGEAVFLLKRHTRAAA